MEKLEAPSSHVEPLDTVNMLDDCEFQEGLHETSKVNEKETNDFEDVLTESLSSNPDVALQPKNDAYDVNNEVDWQLRPDENAPYSSSTSDETSQNEIVKLENSVHYSNSTSEESSQQETDDQVKLGQILGNLNATFDLTEQNSPVNDVHCGNFKLTEDVDTPNGVDLNQPLKKLALQGGDAEPHFEEDYLEASEIADIDIEHNFKSHYSKPDVSPSSNDALNHNGKLQEPLISSRNGKLKETIFVNTDSVNALHETSISDDILPPSGLAKRLVDKWSNIAVELQPPTQKAPQNEDFHYAPNTAKTIAAKFSSGNFQTNSNAHTGDEDMKKAYTNGTHPSRDLSGKGDQNEAELPVEGITRGLIAKFSSMEA